MDHFVDERDYKLLEGDKYTFFVLRRIIDGPCKLLLSDHERLIICFSEEPYPTWIWTPDDVTEEEMENAYLLLKENNLITEEHTFNMKYELLDYFINRALKDGISLALKLNMYAYDCFKPLQPKKTAEGEICKCEREHTEELADFIEEFHEETGVDRMDRAGCLEHAKVKIEEGKTFFWKDGQGNHVASCSYNLQGELASVNLVYTKPEHRRKHYAEHLVYQVSKLVTDAGYIPMLYTNADYKASNACYEKIGYVLRGKLCSVG
ncbi:MAG: GNAT family N-acetyltransferase [Lachnospiraceae bacterium]|nr:GNAT family N-acetyltransferase [Lachnospiraceae bacterium]